MRTEVRRVTAGLSDEYILSSNSAILERLAALPEFIGARRIFAYCSVGREIDTRSLIARCLQSGRPVALPRTEADGKMSFALIHTPPEKFAQSAFGIPEPNASEPPVYPAPDDLVVVPALCFDKSGFRLGHGGGYYDRFLSGCPSVSVGLCREKLLRAGVPAEPHDIRVNIIITENRTARPAGGPAK